MRLVKTLIYLTLAFQLTWANATGSEINEKIHTVIKNNATPLFRSMYLLKNTDKTLDQSDENTRQLVIALLLQKPNQTSSRFYKTNQLTLMRQRLLIHANCESDYKPKSGMIYFAPLLIPRHVP